MIFAKTETQKMIADTVRRLLAKANDFEARRHRLAGKNPDRLALWPEFAAAGVTATLFPEDAGGLGGTPRDAAVVLYEIGRSLAVEPYLACLVSGRILLQAPPDIAAPQIDAMLGGRRIIVLAGDEGPDPFKAPQTQARADGGGYKLYGVKPAVRHADLADALIVTARMDDGKLGCFLVAQKSPGLQITPYRLIDAASGGRVQMDGVAGVLLLAGDAAERALADAASWQVAGLAAEAAGMMDALNAGTAEYLRTRKQFGVTLGSFQALQRRLADLYIAREEAFVAAEVLLGQMETAPEDLQAALASIVKVTIDRCGRKISHEAVQMHGGMGVSDELNISHYMRRFAAMRAESGGETIHTGRFGTIAGRSNRMLWFEEAAEEAAQRAEVRDFVQANLPAAIAAKVKNGLELTKRDFVAWEKILHAHGWYGVAWPQEFGGAGWDLKRQLAFVQEAALNYAPMIIPYGVNMVGPVLYTFGTAEQQAKYLPDILSNKTWWCQGYSEPNSGSDLASLRTFAELDGEHYVINGTKMWTTEAHWADMMHCLVRTRRDGKPQEGITFLLIDMKTPGITIRPIITNDGQHHTNQTFFDNVRVQVENRVGEEGAGWRIAKFLLANERLAIADTGAKLRLLQDVKRIFAAYIGAGKVADPVAAVYASKLAGIEIQLAVLCFLERHYIAAWADGASRDGPEASILKIRGTEILQAISELALDLEGPVGMIHDPADLHLPVETALNEGQRASVMGHHYLYGRAWSIFGGTNEVQRNIIARYALAG